MSGLLLRRFLELKRVKLFHSTHPYNLPISSRFKTLAVVYDLIPLIFYDVYLRPKRINAKVSYSYYLRQLRRVDHLIAISERTRRDCIEHLGIDGERITVIPLGVDGNVFRRLEDPIARQELREKLLLPQEFFLYVGGLDFRKNADRVITAFAHVSSSVSHDLIFAGASTTEEVKKITSRAFALGIGSRVHIVSGTSTEELVGLYSLATALLFPSLYEGFGLPVVEAFCCGTAVLCSDNSSLIEVARDAALLVDPTDGTDIERGIVSIANNNQLRETLRRKGYDRAQLYTPQRMIDATIALYENVLKFDPPIGRNRSTVSQATLSSGPIQI